MSQKLSQRAYARHRAERGLPGSSRGAVRAAVESGRIEEAVDGNGRINVELADRLWRARTQRRADTASRRADPGQEGFHFGVKAIAGATMTHLPRLAAFLAVEAGAPAEVGYSLSRMLPMTMWSIYQDALDELDELCERDGAPPLWGRGDLKLAPPEEPIWELLAANAGEELDLDAWEAHFQGIRERDDDE